MLLLGVNVVMKDDFWFIGILFEMVISQFVQIENCS